MASWQSSQVTSEREEEVEAEWRSGAEEEEELPRTRLRNCRLAFVLFPLCKTLCE